MSQDDFFWLNGKQKNESMAELKKISHVSFFNSAMDSFCIFFWFYYYLNLLFLLYSNIRNDKVVLKKKNKYILYFFQHSNV